MQHVGRWSLQSELAGGGIDLQTHGVQRTSDHANIRTESSRGLLMLPIQKRVVSAFGCFQQAPRALQNTLIDRGRCALCISCQFDKVIRLGPPDGKSLTKPDNLLVDVCDLIVFHLL